MVDGREPKDVHQKKEPCHFDHPIQSYTQRRDKRGEQTAQKARGMAEKGVRYDLKSSKVGRGESP
ncbi:hypothetical protein BKA82DRAFT_1002801, partial [Pisolithus tinctorius]